MAAQPRIYNPALLSKDELKDTFIARKETLDELIDHIAKHRPGEPCRHLIIVGSRGMGKTTLGLRVLYEIEDNPALSDTWQPVPFSEESYGITDAADLWLTALNHLSHAVDDDTWAEYSRKISESESDALRLEAYALDALNEYCEEANKRVILFIENVDHMFEQFKSKREVHAIRAAIMTNPKLLIVGTANSVFAGIQKYSEPFYGFFQLFHLEGLGRHEAQKLIGTILTQSNRKECDVDLSLTRGRMEAIRRLTGGNPRSVLMAAQILAEAPLNRANVLERLIDEQTPYFKARIEELPVQARKVFNQLADGWRPMLAREVAARTRLGTSQTSAQMRILIDRGYVREVRLVGETRIRYELCDRFFNIYHLYRLSRSKRERLERFVEFIYELFGGTTIRHLYLNLQRIHKNDQSASKDVNEILSVLGHYITHDNGLADRGRRMSNASGAADVDNHPSRGGGEGEGGTSDWVQLGKLFQYHGRVGDAITAYIHAIREVLPSSVHNDGSQELASKGTMNRNGGADIARRRAREIFLQVTSSIDLDQLSAVHRLELGCVIGLIGSYGTLVKDKSLTADAFGWALRCMDINDSNSGHPLELKAALLSMLLGMIGNSTDLGKVKEREYVIECLAEVKKSNEELWNQTMFRDVVLVARILVVDGQFELFRKVSSWTISQFPEKAESWRLHAMSELAQANNGWRANSIDYVKKALSIEPSDPWNHHTAALVEAKRGEWDNALEHLETCFELDLKFAKDGSAVHAPLLFYAACAGKQQRVVQIMERANLQNELEPLWYALQPEEDLDAVPLPREIVDTAKHIRSKLNEETRSNDWDERVCFS